MDRLTRGRHGASRVAVRGFDDPRFLLSSALLLHGFRELARRAVEDVNLGHVSQIELMDQTHRPAAVRTR